MIKINKIKILLPLIVLCVLLSAIPAMGAELSPSTGKGHVIFFFTAGMERAEYRKAYGEFIYSYNSAKDMLKGEGYTYALESSMPISISNGGLSVSLGKKNLSQSAGVIFVRPGGTFRVSYGVFKSMDILKMARDYFRRR